MSTHSFYRPEGTRYTVDPDTLFARLREHLEPESLIIHEAGRRPYECDGLATYKQLPVAVAIPDDLAQLQGIMRVCHELGVPVVARGAGTSLSGGAMPHPQGILLSLAKFNRILDINPRRRTAQVQPGVRNLAVSEAAAPHGLYYAPDPSSQIACTIGGNIAENAGGVHCLKYGLTVHNVLALKMVTVDGELVELGGLAPDSPGLDLLALTIGSEGMLGVVVEATLQLLPQPVGKEVLMAAFDDVAAGGRAVATIIGDGVVPAGLEMMDGPAIQAAEEFVGAGYPTDAAAILICELDGQPDEVAELLERVKTLLAQEGTTQIHVAADDAERQRLWAGRKAAFPAVGRISPDYYCMDGTIPRRKLTGVLTRIAELATEYGLRVVNVFHAGDGNLHPLILFDANVPGQMDQAEALGGAILELCVAAGGTITGEHGVGSEKINQMCVQFQSPELRQFHAVKAAFDPAELLNPGKGVPTLQRCAEFGKMHVQNGALPHPELERF